MPSFKIVGCFISVSLMLILIRGSYSSEDEAEGQDHLYPCFLAAMCDSSLEQKYTDKKVEILEEVNPDVDVPLVIDSIRDAGYFDFGTYDIDEAMGIYCPIEDEEREDLFNKGGTIVLEEFSSACSDMTQGELCAHLNQLVGMASDLADMMHRDGVC